MLRLRNMLHVKHTSAFLTTLWKYRFSKYSTSWYTSHVDPTTANGNHKQAHSSGLTNPRSRRERHTVNYAKKVASCTHAGKVLTGKSHGEITCADRKITLLWIVGQYAVRIWTGFIRLRTDQCNGDDPSPRCTWTGNSPRDGAGVRYATLDTQDYIRIVTVDDIQMDQHCNMQHPHPITTKSFPTGK
jgi:hypothetical protein